MSKRKLLLADDSVTIQKVVNLTFAGEGIDVITAGDGNAAIDHINAGLPDIILADINMPGTNGYQLCEMIRANEQTASIPVILLVGSFEPFDANEAARVGASSVLTKPFSSIRALVDKVFELLDVSVSQDEEIHETYAQPVEAAPAVEPSNEPDDIEDLYHQSLNGTESEDEPETIEFVDAGMDDEMVETEHLQNQYLMADVPVQQEESVVQDEFVAGPEAFEDTIPDATGSITDAPLADLGNIDQPQFGEVTQEFETFDEFKEESIDDADEEDVEEFNTTINNYRQNFEMLSEQESPASEPIPEYTEGEPDDDEPETYDEPEQFDEPFSVIEPIAENENFPVPEPIFDQQQTSPPEPNAYEFEEIELLQLPRVNDTSELNLVTSSEAIAQDNMQRAVSLSPELIEMIVERVVERLRRDG